MSHPRRDRSSVSILLSHCPLPKGAATPGDIPKGRILQAPALTQLRDPLQSESASLLRVSPPLPQISSSGLAVGRAWSCQRRTFPWEKRPPPSQAEAVRRGGDAQTTLSLHPEDRRSFRQQGTMEATPGMALLRKPKTVSGREETPRTGSLAAAFTQSPLEVTQSRLPPLPNPHPPRHPQDPAPVLPHHPHSLLPSGFGDLQPRWKLRWGILTAAVGIF